MSEDNDLLNSLFGMLDDGGEKGDVIVKQPLFNYAGSKFRSVKEIIPLLPDRKGYIEPFGGSGSILINRKKSRLEVLNDRNSGITDFYLCIQDAILLEQMIEKINLCIHSKEFFVNAKRTWEQATTPLERGFRWYYMTMTSFGAMGRNWGRATTPSSSTFGTKIFSAIPRFREIHARLRGVQIENTDFRRLMQDYNNEDFVMYLDPPYPTTHQSMYRHKMNDFDYKALFEGIKDYKGFVAISGYEQEAGFIE